MYLFSRIILFIIFFITFYVNPTYAQNLIKNPSFENLSSLPNSVGQVNKAKKWEHAVTSPDLFHQVSFPTFNSQPHLGGAHTGKAFIGMVVLPITNGIIAESIMQNISDNSIVKNRVYTFKVYAKRTIDGGLYANPCSKLELYGFETLPNNVPTTGTHISDIENSVLLWSSNQKVSSIEWSLFGGCFMAPENINHIVITQAKSTNCEAYIFIDDVSITLADTTGAIKLDTAICEGETLELNTNPKYKGWEYGWNTGLRTEKIAVTDSGTYWVTHYDSNFCET
ncbi:MAG: hypothetical protein ACPGLV_13160 [Bacteroidia bacterium]